MTQEDLEEIASHTKESIENATETRENMLEFIGATKDKKHKQTWQNALLLYPDLINDPYFKKMIKIKKAALIKEARSGKIVIPNTNRTFLILPSVVVIGLEVWIIRGSFWCQLYEDERVRRVKSSFVY
jgi:hypothetical protein